MTNRKLTSYLWALAGILIAIGFVIHPTLTAEGMRESIWVPDHVIILLALFLMVFALGNTTYGHAAKVDTLGWSGFVLLYLSIFLFIGIVYFELFLIPILAVDLPQLFDDGLRIGPLKVILPVSSLLFVGGHLLYGISLIKKGVLPKLPFMALIVFSIPVAFKPVLPDIVASIGAIGYGLAAIFFAMDYAKHAPESV